MASSEPWVGMAITGKGVVSEAAATLQGVHLAKDLHLTTVTQPESRGEQRNNPTHTAAYSALGLKWRTSGMRVPGVRLNMP